MIYKPNVRTKFGQELQLLEYGANTHLMSQIWWQIIPMCSIA